MGALRNAFRSLRHSPAFTVMVVLTLAVGIGLNDAVVSPRFAETLGVLPLAGRSFIAERPLTATSASEAMVSASFARAQFGSPAAALGATLHAGPLTREIVGVLPDGFHFPQHTDVWIEAGTAPEITNRTAYNQAMVARRRASTTPEALAAALQTEAHRLAASFPHERNVQFRPSLRRVSR